MIIQSAMCFGHPSIVSGGGTYFTSAHENWPERIKDLTEGEGVPHTIQGHLCQSLSFHCQWDQVVSSKMAAERFLFTKSVDITIHVMLVGLITV
jgi:hypothetical protein